MIYYEIGGIYHNNKLQFLTGDCQKTFSYCCETPTISSPTHCPEPQNKIGTVQQELDENKIFECMCGVQGKWKMINVEYL